MKNKTEKINIWCVESNRWLYFMIKITGNWPSEVFSLSTCRLVSSVIFWHIHNTKVFCLLTELPKTVDASTFSQTRNCKSSYFIAKMKRNPFNKHNYLYNLRFNTFCDKTYGLKLNIWKLNTCSSSWLFGCHIQLEIGFKKLQNFQLEKKR